MYVNTHKHLSDMIHNPTDGFQLCQETKKVVKNKLLQVFKKMHKKRNASNMFSRIHTMCFGGKVFVYRKTSYKPLRLKIDG